MATDPLDVAAVVAAAGTERWTGMPDGTVMGHVHLHVGNLDEAPGFNGDVRGFDRMVWRYPGALFMGAGGYHHHVGTNTWARAGRRRLLRPRPSCSSGRWCFQMPPPRR